MYCSYCIPISPTHTYTPTQKVKPSIPSNKCHWDKVWQYLMCNNLGNGFYSFSVIKYCRLIQYTCDYLNFITSCVQCFVHQLDHSCPSNIYRAIGYIQCSFPVQNLLVCMYDRCSAIKFFIADMTWGSLCTVLYCTYIQQTESLIY